MGDQNLRPLAPAGFYLLDLSATPGITDSVPLQLILSEVVPVLPAQSRECVSHSNNIGSPIRESVINSIGGEGIPQVTTQSASRVNIILNEVVKPNTKHSNLQTKETKKKNISKDIIRPESKQECSQNTNKRCVKPANRIENYIHISDNPVVPRALAVLPKALKMVNGSIYPVRSLPPRVRFGPVQGVFQENYHTRADDLIKVAMQNETPIFLLMQNEFSVTYINVTDKEQSNWLSLLPLGKKNTANVWLYEEDHELYGITTRSISSKTPLALGYSKQYADDHNLVNQPVLDLDNDLFAQPLWWCKECRKDLGSPTLLQQHISVNHTKTSISRRKRCSFCSRTFSRLFTLRRHKKVCTKIPEQIRPSTPKTSTEQSTVTKQNLELCTSFSQSAEETRIPSDESFQNYTNALDFSTNLFDPDRISNLDISGSFDNLDSNDDYSKFCKGLKLNTDKITFEEPAIVTCLYCKQTMTKVKKRRHLRECPARRLVCECGKKFTRKDDFAKHVYFNHNTIVGNQVNEESADNKSDAKSLPYKCDDCKLKFKRRGMLVNHLWRVHNTKSAEVPLERRIRHYPCSVCPKLYKTAAKRNRHVEVHHPGARVRAAPIEGERRVFQPARCTACPKEYVTKAKLLQHIRAQHPHLAVTTKKPRLKSEPQRTKGGGGVPEPEPSTAKNGSFFCPVSGTNM